MCVQHWLSQQDAAEENSFISSECLVFPRLGVGQKKSQRDYCKWSAVTSSEPYYSPWVGIHHSDVQFASKSSDRKGKTGYYRRHGRRGGSVTGRPRLKQYSQNPRIARSQKDWKRHRIDSPAELQKGTLPCLQSQN